MRIISTYIIGYIALNHPRMTREELKIIQKDLNEYLPEDLGKKRVGRGHVEDMLEGSDSRDIFDVRTFTLIAKAINLYFR